MAEASTEKAQATWAAAALRNWWEHCAIACSCCEDGTFETQDRLHRARMLQHLYFLASARILGFLFAAGEYGRILLAKTGTDEHNRGYENDLVHLGHAVAKHASSEPKTRNHQSLYC